MMMAGIRTFQTGVRFLVVISMVWFFQPTSGGKILVTGTSGGMTSHLMSAIKLANTLSRRGNEVWFIVDRETYEKTVRRSNIRPEIQLALYEKVLTNEDGDTFVRRYVSKQLRDEVANTAWQYQLEAQDREIQTRLSGRKVDVFKASSFVIDDMLGNTALMEQLKSEGFDMIVGDFVSLYQVFLSQVLEVPYIHIGMTTIAPSQHDRFAYNPVNPAYVPERMSFLTDTMSFRERCKNTFMYWLTSFFFYKFMLGPLDEVLMKRNIRPDANFGQLLSEAEMWIFNSDFVVEFPRPLSPHVKFVGGLLTDPPKPLDEEWQAFFESSGEHGVVMLALGTLINDELSEEQAENIATSLAMLPQKVAWSFGGKLPRTLGNNTRVVKWFPQNDLLAHPKTRALISHGGINSIHQGVYHAVPIVGIPVFGDQKDNFYRVGAKGISVLLDIRHLTERSIYDATIEVIYNKSYKDTVDRYSAIARDRIVTGMSPVEEAAYWVEYAIKHGTGHLKPRAMQLSLIQYYLIDVIAVSVVIATVVSWCLLKVCCWFQCPIGGIRKI